MSENEDDKCKVDLRAIKSPFIKKKIFLFLNEKQILKMIAYNKELQQICLIGIEDF